MQRFLAYSLGVYANLRRMQVPCVKKNVLSRDVFPRYQGEQDIRDAGNWIPDQQQHIHVLHIKDAVIVFGFSLE